MTDKQPSYRQQALDYHEFPKPGKLSVESSKPCATAAELSLTYTPGVAEPVREIHQDPDAAYRYTNKGNLIAVITDGTAVLGLGNVGPLASKPVMEGKAVLFKRFADIDVFDNRYLELDSWHAVNSLYSKGIKPFCLNLDSRSDAAIEHIFGKGRFETLERLNKLPEVLSSIYVKYGRH